MSYLTWPMSSPPRSHDPKIFAKLFTRSKGSHSTSSEALPGQPHVLQEAFQSGRELSKPPGAVELDVRQVHSLVVSESWWKRGTEQEETGLLQHGKWYIIMTTMCMRYHPPSGTVTEQDFDDDLFWDSYLLKSRDAQRREMSWGPTMPRGQDTAKMTSCQFLSTLMGTGR